MPTSPRNTSADAQNDPMGMLLEMMAGRTSGDAIYAQEASGQRSFTTSDTLPTDMGQDDRKALEQAGVVFGDQVPGDEMFTYATLPAGWKKVATSHSMWSHLVDDKGRKRASMFYKAAFYDRSAHLNTNRRFGVGMDYERSDEGAVVKFVTDGETKVFTTKEYPYEGEEHGSDYREQNRAANDEVVTWLKERYPNWEDPSAYWD